MDRPKIGIGVIVCREGGVLMGKRKNAHGAGAWCFPGGHLEFGESWEECAKREVLEETGLVVSDIRFAAATNDVFLLEEKHYVTLYMIADSVEGEPVVCEPDKCEEWRWVTWESMPRPLFLPIENLLKSGFVLR